MANPTPKRRVITKAKTPLQQVCMQYGKDCRALSNSYLLERFLKENGFSAQAGDVGNAIAIAKQVARRNYFRDRKKLQPDWKDWDQQNTLQQLENIAAGVPLFNKMDRSCHPLDPID